MTTETNPVIFHTNGPIDPRSWRLMGISAKESGSPIGMFGTGLKYAIAVFLRLGHTFTIWSEGQTYEFTTQDIDFRGKDFRQICCNGEELSFTTEYGKNWEPWQAYRELVSNTMDEGGIHFSGAPFDHGTSIIVDGEAVRECMTKHDDFFVSNREVIAETSAIRIYEGSGTIFYRGVKVGTVTNALHSYEVLEHLDLTEDRTIKSPGTVRCLVGRELVRNIKDAKLPRHVMTADIERWEHGLDYGWNSWSNKFKEVASDLWKNNPTSLNKHIFKLVRKNIEDIAWDSIPLDEDQQGMLDKALGFLSRAGYPVTAPVRMVENDDQNVVAFVYNGGIHLTEKSFDRGMFFLITTLMEEHFHTLGHDDNSRSFESFLMDELTKQAAKRLKEYL